MPDKKPTTQYVDIKLLRPYGKNPRTIKDENFRKLCASVKDNPGFFFARPCLASKVDGHYVVYAGNQRLKAAKEIGLKQVPVIIENLSEAEMKERMIRDNVQSGEWDVQALEADFSQEQLMDFGLDNVSASKKVKEEIEQAELEKGEVLGESVDGEDIKGKPKMFGLKEDYKFDSHAPMDIPELKPDMIPCLAGKAVSMWKVDPKVGDYWFYNYGSDSVREMDFTKCILGFYVEDTKFECFWEAPSSYATKVLNRQMPLIVEPNFSCHFDDPQAIRVYNIYRARWISRYFQEAGIPVIPDIKGSVRDFDFMFAGIPERAGCVAIQVHTNWKDDPTSRREKIAVINKTIDKINPRSVFFYGNPYDKKIIDKECAHIPNQIWCKTRNMKYAVAGSRGPSRFLNDAAPAPAKKKG